MLRNIVNLSVALLVVGVLFPVGLSAIANATISDPTVATVFTILLPVLAIIGVALYFMPKFSGKD